MNRYLLALATAAGLLIGGMGAAMAQYGTNDGQNRWMTVNNHTNNATAINIHIIASGANCCWSQDLLGSNVVSAGRSFNVNFDNGSRACVFDIRITSETRGRDWVFNAVDVCRESALNLR